MMTRGIVFFLVALLCLAVPARSQEKAPQGPTVPIVMDLPGLK